MRVLLSGATGLVGAKLARALTLGGAEVWALSRSVRSAGNGVARWFAWDAIVGAPPREALDGVEAVVHLAGEPLVGARWTPERKRSLWDSRVLGTRHLVDALAARSDRPRVLVSASAVGFYGNAGDAIVNESSQPGVGFLADLCLAWEQEARRAEGLGVRVASPRIGVVLASEGGALSKMLPPFRLGLGGWIGSGQQYLPWIHLDDLVAILRLAIDRHQLKGPVNAVAPQAVTNREFSVTLGRVLHRPVMVPVPIFAIRAAMGEMACTVVEGQRVAPAVLDAAGFAFRYAELEGALKAAVSRDAPTA